jgi:hypothetical protein
MALDPSIKFRAGPAASATASAQPNLPKTSAPPVTTGPSFQNPSKGSIGAFLANLLSGIFKRK